MTTTTEEVTLETLQEEIAALRRQRLEERRNIVEVARQYAAENSLCEVVDAALRDAGLLEGVEVTVQANVPVQVVMRVDSGADIPAVQEMINAHRATISDILVDGLGHIRGLAYGNEKFSSAQISLSGEIQVVTVEEGTPGRTPPNRRTWGRNAADMNNNWARPPQNYLALYTAPQGQVVHFVEAMPEARGNYQVSDGGITWNVRRVPLCVPSRPIYGWQFESPRARNIGNGAGICFDCAERARNQFGWQGVHAR